MLKSRITHLALIALFAGAAGCVAVADDDPFADDSALSVTEPGPGGADLGDGDNPLSDEAELREDDESWSDDDSAPTVDLIDSATAPIMLL